MKVTNEEEEPTMMLHQTDQIRAEQGWREDRIHRTLGGPSGGVLGRLGDAVRTYRRRATRGSGSPEDYDLAA